jgi:hypothetical protein
MLVQRNIKPRQERLPVMAKISAVVFLLSVLAVAHGWPEAPAFREARRSLILVNVLGPGITYDYNLTRALALGGGILFVPGTDSAGDLYFPMTILAHANFYLSPGTWRSFSFLVSPTYQMYVDYVAGTGDRLTNALTVELGCEYRKRIGLRASAGLGLNLNTLFSDRVKNFVTLPWISGILGIGVAF